MLFLRTGRATVVEFVGDERMNAASASAWLGAAAGHGHDVVVVAIGMNDALRLSTLAKWRDDLRAVVEQVLSEGDPAAQVLLVGLPHVRSYLMADSWMGAVANRRAQEMTAALVEIAAASSRVWFVPAPVEQFEQDRPLGSSAMYQAWSEGLVEHVMSRLEEVRVVRPPVTEPVVQWDWVGTPAALERSETGVVSARLEGIVAAVQDRFGVAIAAVNLLDGDRTHFIAGGVGAPRSLPRSLAYCNTTVQDGTALVVLDAKKDARFRDNPFLDVVGLPFYAGVPLHASDGRAVATLCVLDSAPRSAFDIAALQQFASGAEEELQAIEWGDSSANDPARSERTGG